MPYAMELVTPNKTWYRARNPFYHVTEDLNLAEIYRSKKEININIKRHKDALKRIYRETKNQVVTRYIDEGIPKQFTETEIDINALKINIREVNIVLAD